MGAAILKLLRRVRLVNNQTYSSVIGVVALTGLLGALGCAGVKEKGSSTGSAGTGDTSGAGLSTGTAGTGVMPTACTGKCTDFPTDPINTNIPGSMAGMLVLIGSVGK